MEITRYTVLKTFVACSLHFTLSLQFAVGSLRFTLTAYLSIYVSKELYKLSFTFKLALGL